MGPRDAIVEIGSGPGALSERILRYGAQLMAVEKDPLFATSLERLQTEDARLKVIQGDILDCDTSSFLPKHKQKIKVVANLPYQITTPILIKLLPLYEEIQTLTLMVQYEVALRLFAEKGSKDYSSLTLFLRYYAEPISFFKVKPTSFFPVPGVHSAVVQIRLKKPPELPPEDFFAVTRSAFGQRRKMIRVGLKQIRTSEEIEAACTLSGISSTMRPQDLGFDDFLRLACALKRIPPTISSPPKPKKS